MPGKLLVRVGRTGSEYTELRGDRITGALMSMSYEHHEIHAGSMFEATISDADFDANDTINICFKTAPGDKKLHMVADPDSSLLATFTILEGATVTADSGTEAAPYNRNRDSSNTSIIYDITAAPSQNSYSYNCTITDDGTTIHSEAIGSGGRGVVFGRRDANEWVLASDTVYGFRLTRSAATDNGIGFLTLIWYEPTDRD